MVNLLRDPIWQFIGVIIALSALILSFWLYKKQTTKKELLWDITKCISLSSFNISEKVKSTIMFEKTLLEDVSLIYLKIWNSGNVEIRPEEYIVLTDVERGLLRERKIAIKADFSDHIPAWLKIAQPDPQSLCQENLPVSARSERLLSPSGCLCE